MVNEHYKHLDGLRGLASSFVVLHHAWQAAMGTTAFTGFMGFAFNWLLYGHLAVDVFIVISGFCLTLPMLRAEKVTYPKFRRFYFGRVRRILPAYFAMLIIAIFLSVMARVFFGKSPGLPFEFRHIVANALLLQDIFPELNIFNMASWSVALEMHIYILFPILFVICMRRGISIFMLLTILIGYGVTLFVQHVSVGQDLSKSCIWYIALFSSGMAAAFKLRKKEGMGLHHDMAIPVVVFFALIAISLIQWFPIGTNNGEEKFLTVLPYIDGAVGVSTAAFLLWTTRCVDVGNRNMIIDLLTAKPIVWVGTFAYSLYLVHFPLFQYLRQGLAKLAHIEHDLISVVIFSAFGIPFVFILAYGFFILFERPFMSKRLQDSALNALHN
jgi:peptidoglycan/LPS O-acetylase OafA/YrhL